MDAVVLAAGKSSRMKTSKSKIFYDLCGKSIISHIVDTLKNSGFEKIIIAANKENEQELSAFGSVVVQKIQNGTAKACELALPYISDDFLVINADSALITPYTLKIAREFFLTKNLDCLLLVAEVDDPTGYGRIVKHESGIRIIEQKDANSDILKINLVSSGIFFLKKDFALTNLPKIDNNNAQGEYYLPDLVKFAKNCDLFEVEKDEILGINTQKEYSNVRKIMQKRIIEAHMQNGVVFIDPDTTYIDINVQIGQDTLIYPNVHIRKNTKIGKNCIIDTGCIIDSCDISDNVVVKPYSVLTGSVIQENCSIGPFSHLRPDNVIKKNVHIGNFVEVKKSILDENTKASHLSYIGDAIVGKNVNVGAGTITCNYDGYKKHQTLIGDNVFIGSDTQLVAPVKIGNDCLIAAGTTVTKDTPPFSLVLSRVPQQVKENWVIEYRKRHEEK
ncbi:MAG: bifunctional UDP-N-acetylglucosamine diphosphorylase/glucosamine-1-phosphate N-acetyltransferase GlmU [Desulfurella sp.]|uniref:bifunctional UDP-N-acetylglucosamine diphosphorylase/glucosamine-1-phosphate N-acetyltransferase GlmU n=1 Tax=Desulfurella TaxID=33001 RepID=UPI000CB77CE9|nr:bifunctional UDP-N-acetylglucosamine diphosphorylase/glucosamine-1-phosphate N-acetyltransferase GlmU [Desulfurella multipotens]PMP67183.1 MAG: UDP-N-acetylglucosamine diphosphorylase/glucosamine-1-phosphate N-acetyltransferase [Desulfurella multipotens]